ncbi:hypothetical protein ACFWWT_26865 [Streptomyces sp. NPDC058676]|uniref:hypothetical protein n=1 Tax=unclassified Streptomyces TaxID=2593676 RepID=UPI0036643ACF
MRSTRMLLATAAAAAVVGIAAPGAHAADGDWGREKSSDSHESSSYGKEHGKDGKHDAPRGGMHTGGGALTVADDEEWATARDPKHDPETYRNDKDGTEAYKDTKHDPETYKDSYNGGHSKDGYDKHDSETYKDSYSGGHSKGGYDKPHGGVHTGGGALASPGVTAGGLAVLAVAGGGLYMARRNRAAGNLA